MTAHPQIVPINPIHLRIRLYTTEPVLFGFHSTLDHFWDVKREDLGVGSNCPYKCVSCCSVVSHCGWSSVVLDGINSVRQPEADHCFTWTVTTDNKNKAILPCPINRLSSIQRYKMNIRVRKLVKICNSVYCNSVYCNSVYCNSDTCTSDV
jgi:hypothetical protein